MTTPTVMSRSNGPPPRRPRAYPGRVSPAGLTLAELMIAMAITGVIASAVAAMLFSASYGTRSQGQTRNLVVGQEMVKIRLASAVRASTRVLAQGGDYLVLWTADTRINDAPDLSELHRIERDPATGKLWSYQAPAGLAEADDTEYDLGTTNFDAVTGSLKGTANFPGELWATDVTALALVLNAADPLQSGFVAYRIDMTLDGSTETAIGGVALRN